VEGLYFYGLAWASWIIATFILSKNSKIRLPLAAASLFMIIIAPYTISVGLYSVTYISMFMVLISFVTISQFPFRSKLYFFITSLIISVGYVTFLLFELFDPIWVIFKREWLVALFLTYLSVLLQKRLIGRLLTVITGVVYGEVLFALIIYRFAFPYEIGSMELLDICSLSTIMIFAWQGLKVVIGYFEGHYQPIEREKQKTT
jgi:hypothetical protein